MLIAMLIDLMIAKRLGLPNSLSLAKGIAEKASQPKIIANQTMYSGWPAKLSVSAIGLEKAIATKTKVAEVIKSETKAEAYTFSLSVSVCEKRNSVVSIP